MESPCALAQWLRDSYCVHEFQHTHILQFVSVHPSEASVSLQMKCVIP